MRRTRKLNLLAAALVSVVAFTTTVNPPTRIHPVNIRKDLSKKSLMAAANVTIAAVVTCADDIQAVNPAGSGEALREKTQRLVSDLISLPLQNNFDFGSGPTRRNPESQ